MLKYVKDHGAEFQALPSVKTQPPLPNSDPLRLDKFDPSTAVLYMPMDPWLVVSVEPDRTYYAEKAEAIMGGYRPRSLSRTLLKIGLFALLPPIVLMVTALAAAWVVRGFVRPAA